MSTMYLLCMGCIGHMGVGNKLLGYSPNGTHIFPLTIWLSIHLTLNSEDVPVGREKCIVLGVFSASFWNVGSWKCTNFLQKKTGTNEESVLISNTKAASKKIEADSNLSSCLDNLKTRKHWPPFLPTNFYPPENPTKGIRRSKLG